MTASDQGWTREIFEHAVEGGGDPLRILVMDEPGPGNANHDYIVRFDDPDGVGRGCSLVFQNGPLKEVGANGISNESVLAVVQDRLRCFQAGPFACHENEIALHHVTEALEALKNRTRDRIARQVEGRTAV